MRKSDLMSRPNKYGSLYVDDSPNTVVQKKTAAMRLVIMRQGFMLTCIFLLIFSSINSLYGAASEKKSGGQSTTDKALIISGSRVGPLHLGQSREEAINTFGDPLEEHHYDIAQPCPAYRDCDGSFGDMFWYNFDLKQNSIFIYLCNSKIIQINAPSNRYSTEAGIKSGSSPEKLRKLYPTMIAFELLNSGSPAVGSRNLIYWDDQKAGIAFELYYDRRVHKRLISQIIIHKPNVPVIPDNCNDGKRLLKPFSLP